MDFSLSKQEQLFLQMIREFAEKEVKPLAAEVDESERFPMETVQKMAKLGIMGIPFPVELGGAGGSNILYTMAVEELSRVCATTGVIVSAHTSLCCAPIMEHGTPEQKAKYLPKLASGEWIGAFGLTEPNAGTDASAQQTIAVKEGDHYVLNGSKIFITNAGYAHVYIIMAMTDKSKGTKGISAFIVDMKQEGVSCGKPEKKMGVVGCATSDIILENVQEEHLKPVLAKLAECNIKTERTAEGIQVWRRGRLCGVQVKTMPFPGFPTDMQAPFMSLLAVAKGTSVMTETIFENRFSHVGELQRMGANIKIDSRSAVIEGVETLTGAKVRATDLRAGAALILSALAAKGETEISDIYHIERGYDRIDEKLRRLGADIRREEE
mgnify:CR=1 FL=1